MNGAIQNQNARKARDESWRDWNGPGDRLQTALPLQNFTMESIVLLRYTLQKVLWWCGRLNIDTMILWKNTIYLLINPNAHEYNKNNLGATVYEYMNTM